MIGVTSYLTNLIKMVDALGLKNCLSCARKSLTNVNGLNLNLPT